MLTFPNAKINLGLNIIRKRPDGYHDLQSVFYPIGLRDALEVIENTSKTTERIQFTTSGIAIPGEIKYNLCWFAYHLIANDYKLPNVKVHLHKQIPIGAGLGGGSADAAFFIRLLNDTFELGLSWGEMHHYARQLGSDCSFFITNRPAYAQAKGDEYETIHLDLSNYFIALVYPPIHINTAKAYSGVVPMMPTHPLEHDIVNLPITKWKDRINNDFEKSIFPQFQTIKTIKDKLYRLGAVYASMSGSGSSVYGIFKSETNLKSEFKNYFLWEGKL